MANTEDNLIGMWKSDERRTLLDMGTKGKFKTSKDLPPLSTTGKVTSENLKWIYDRFFGEKDVEFKGGPGSILEAVSPAGIVSRANTASKMFSGWGDNLTSYISTLSKKKGNRLKGVLKRAFDDLYGAIDSGDIKQVQQSLIKINKDNDLHKFVKVPEITTEGIAGGAARQAQKVKGATLIKSRQTVNKQSRDLANERRMRAEQERIDKGLQRGSRRSGIK